MLACICCDASPFEGVGELLVEVVCESDIDMTIGTAKYQICPPRDVGCGVSDII